MELWTALSTLSNQETNLGQDDREATVDTPFASCRSICLVEPLLVVRVTRIKANPTESAVRNLRDSSIYKMVMIERQGAIRCSFVPE